jgi:hypothetical protein
MPNEPGHGTPPVSRGNPAPVLPAVRNMHSDPASHSVDAARNFMSNKMESNIAANIQSVQAARITAADQKAQEAQQRESAAEFIRRANPDYNPTQAALMDRAHGGSNDVYGKDSTTLLLNSIGYTGNGIPDFNAQVDRINKTFQEVYGHAPTPGFVLDLVRSPVSSDPNALKNLLQGVPQAGLQANPFPTRDSSSAGVVNPERIGEQAGVTAALKASLFSGDATPLFAAAGKVMQSRRDEGLVSRYAAGDPMAGAQLASIIPGPAPLISAVQNLNAHMKQFGIMPATFAGKTWQENQALFDATVGHAGSQNRDVGPTLKSAHDSFQIISDFQKQMIAKYHLPLKATGYLDDNWAKEVVSLSHTKSYAAQLLVSEASAAGFGGTIDSFNAINQNGQFANNSDGRAAKDAVQQYVAAQHGQKQFLKAHPLGQTFGQEMPLQWFDSGGFSFGSGLDWIVSGSGEITSPFNNPLQTLGGVGDIAEKSLIRGTVSAFDFANAGYAQGKTYLYAASAFNTFTPQDWTSQDYREAAKRLSETNNSWLNILGVSKNWTKNHEELNMLTNLVGDLIVSKRFGSTGETLDTGGSWGGAMHDAVASSDMTSARALMLRGNYATERVGDVWKWGTRARIGKAQNALDSLISGPEAYSGPNWIVDEGSAYGDQFKLDGANGDGRLIRPYQPAEHIEAPTPEVPKPAEANQTVPKVVQDLIAERNVQVAKLNAESAGIKLHVGTPPTPDNLELHSWSDMLEKGLISQETHQNIAAWEALVRQRALDTWKVPTVPARSGLMWQRMQRWGLHGKLPIYTPHPLAFIKGRTWEYVASAFDHADRMFESSDAPGTSFLGNMERGLRTAFMKAPNPRELPVQGLDPRNIYRLGLNAGMSAQKAELAERLFIEGRGLQDQARILKAGQMITEAARAQGREEMASGLQQMFSAGVDRAGESAKFSEAAPGDLFGSKGLLAQRNWAAFQPDANLEAELASKGLHPVKVEINEEPHLFVPGVTQHEAQDLASKYGQQPLTAKGKLLGATYQRAELSGENLENMKAVLGKERPVDNKFMQSLPFGEVTQMNQREHIEQALLNAKTPAEKEMYTTLLRQAKSAPGPLVPEEQLQNFSVPQMMMPLKGGPLGAIHWLNNGLNAVGQIQRRLVLVPDAALFWKHAVTDGLRAIIGEGPVVDIGGAKTLNPFRLLRVFNNRQYGAEFDRFLADNPDLKALHDSTTELIKKGEQRYNLEARGASVPNLFWTGGAPKRWMHAAAGYVDRRLMSGPYQAWKTGGRTGVREWFMSPEGQKLAEAEGFPQEDSFVLANMISDNLDTIRNADPSFLQEAEQIRNTSKHVRDDLAKYMRKNKINIPVSGHVPPAMGRSPLEWADETSQYIIGKYMTMNKFYRGGLYRSMTGRFFHDYVSMGTDPADAARAAMSQSAKLSRYHMLDLADAVKVEQTFRWGALFFTKHRLFWSWMLNTMRARPELMVAARDFQNAMNHYNQKFPGQTPGTFSFYIPARIPWTIPGGLAPQQMKGKTLFTIPVARLLWLTESAGNPGMLSNFIHAASQGQNLFPGRGTVEYTSIDSQLNTMYLMAQHELGNIKTSDGVLSSMNDQDKVRFQGIMARVQAGYYAQHHRYMPDADATSVALKHMFITGIWRTTAFTGSYPEDPRFSNAQERVWQQYNQESNPAVREKLRQDNPWIDTMLGAYTTTNKQHVLSQQMWNQFGQIVQDHEARQTALLTDARTNPERTASDLFGQRWYAEASRYSAAINSLRAQAKSLGAHSWLGQFNADPFAQTHHAFAAELHNMYGMSMAQAKKVAEKGRPGFVTPYRNMLYGPLSPESIAKLPPDQQQSARETATAFRGLIRPYSKEPQTVADRIRANYFSKVYSPWIDQRTAFFQRANLEPTADQGRVYDEMRAWYDSEDHPVKVNGMVMPSPMAVHFAMLPPAAQAQYRRGLMTKQWGWLSKFDKNLLGVKIPMSVQNGWQYYNQTIYDAVGGPKGTIHEAGKHPSITSVDALKYAQYVDTKYPGFLNDYVRGLEPTYARIAQNHVGTTPEAKQTWQNFLGRVSQMADWAAGPMSTNALYMANRADKFHKQVWTDLLETGRQGVLNGLPLARPPEPHGEYPQGGYLYQLAMAQPNRDFRMQFKAWVTSDPNFLYELWN